MKTALELDDLGIVPKSFEEEKEFVKRGNIILRAADELSDRELVTTLQRTHGERFQFFSFPWSEKEQKIIQKNLQYVKKNYGSDLSWLSILRILPNGWKNYPFTPIAGGAIFPILLNKKSSIYMPVIAIFVPKKRIFLHEFIHVAKWTLSRSLFFELAGHHDFEEVVASNGYYRSCPLGASQYLRALWHVRRKLKKFFGHKHGYVFMRLDDAELQENILPKKPLWGDPISYIKRFSDSQLKYKILREKLGL